MRDISSDYMDLLTHERRIKTRFTFRDKRLLFDPFSTGEPNLPEMSHPSHWDAEGFGYLTWGEFAGQYAGTLRVARNSDGYLCYQAVYDHDSDPPWDGNSGNTTAWNVTGHQILPCKPGIGRLSGSQVMHIYAAMDLGDAEPWIVRFDWIHSSFKGPWQLLKLQKNTSHIGSAQTSSPQAEYWQGIAFAGLEAVGNGPERFAVQYFPYTEERDVNFAVIQYVEKQHYSTDPDGSWNVQEFPGGIYGDMQDPYQFDAEFYDGQAYIFTTDSEYGRPLVIKTRPKWVDNVLVNEWSDAKHLLPLDVLDDTSYMKLGAATVLNDQLWVTARLKRSNDMEMDIYMYGNGKNFSIGRDMFIANSDDLPDANPGKLMLMDSSVYYLGHGLYARADATNLIGVDDPERRLVTSDINNFSIQAKSNISCTLSAQTKSDLAHDAIRNNGEVVVDAGLLNDNDAWEWAQLGVFGIDAIARDYFGAGNEQTLMARGMGTKRLSQWTSDAFYDYWSQAKLVADPAELSEVIRVSGQWETDEDMEEEPIRLDRLNETGILYTSAKASRNGQCSAKFYLPGVEDWEEQIMYGRFGVGINYYRESRGQAAERLEKESGDITDNEFGDNGIFAAYDVGEGALILYVVRDSVWYEIERNAFQWPDDAWHWLSIKFQDGFIIVEVGAVLDVLELMSGQSAGEISWFPYIIHQFGTGVAAEVNIEPWFRDQRGRGAIVVENISAHSTTPGFSSTSSIIPVESIDPFPSVGTVIVDSEIITYDGRMAIPAAVDGLEMNWTSGTTHSKAEHDNDLWLDVKIHHIDFNPLAAGEISIGQDYNYNLASMQAFKGPYGRERIDKIRVVLKRVGTPPMPIYAWIVNDSFDNGGMPVGIKDGMPVIPMASAPVAASAVPTSYDWVEFDFTDSYEPLRWLSLTYEKGYFIFLTTIPPVPMANPAEGYNFGRSFSDYDDPDNFYVVRLDNTVSSTTGVWLGWSQNDGFEPFDHYVPGSETMMPFEMYGIGNTPSSGYEIYIDGYLPELGRGALDNAALVVTEGPGAGMAFQVTDYDWRAPKQWVTSRTYLAPDSAENHINDPEHGDWVDFVLSRLFVNSNIYGALSEGSVLEFRPSLVVDERGTDDTVASSHPEGNVSLYSPLSVLTDEVRYFSGEMDMRLEDMARELCARAGVMDFSADQGYDDVFVPWDSTSGDYNVEWMPRERRHGIVQVDGISLEFPGEYGIIYRSDAADISTATQYYVVEFYNNYSFMNTRFGIKRPGESNIAWLEEIPTHGYDIPLSTILFSFQDESTSIWINDKHFHTFVDTELETGEYCGFFTAGTAEELAVKWSSLDMRVDNFVLDLGYRGGQLLSSLIGPKKVIFQDTQTGGIHMERIKTSGEPDYTISDLTTEAARMVVDTKLTNRVRAEGTEIAEIASWEQLREDGNLFALVNATEANSEWEVAREAEFILEDARLSSQVHTIRSAADPRVEANDLVRARSINDYRDLIVQTVNMSMVISGDSARFDMNIEGYNVD